MAQNLTDNLLQTCDTSTQTDGISFKSCKTQSSPQKFTKNNATDLKLITTQSSKQIQTDFIPPTKIHYSTKEIQTDLTPLVSKNTILARKVARNTELSRRIAELRKINKQLKRYIQKHRRSKIEPLRTENTVLSKKLAQLNRINKGLKRFVQNQKIRFEKRCKLLKQKYSSHVYNPFFQFANPLPYSFPNVCPPVWQQPCNSRCNTPYNQSDSRCNTPANKPYPRSNTPCNNRQSNTPYKPNKKSHIPKKDALKKCFGTTFTSSDESSNKTPSKHLNKSKVGKNDTLLKKKHVTLNLKAEDQEIHAELSDSDSEISLPSYSSSSESEQSSVEEKCEILRKIPGKISNCKDTDTSDTSLELEPEKNKRKKPQPELKSNKKTKIDTSWNSVQEIHQKNVNVLNTEASELVEVSPIVISPNLEKKTSKLGKRPLSTNGGTRLTRSGTKLLKSSEPLISPIPNQRKRALTNENDHQRDAETDIGVSISNQNFMLLGSTPKLMSKF